MQFTYFFLFRLFDLLPYSLSMQVKKKKKKKKKKESQGEVKKEPPARKVEIIIF